MPTRVGLQVTAAITDRRPGGDTATLAFHVDGRDLREIAGDAERPFATADQQADLAGRYSWLTYTDVAHWSRRLSGTSSEVWLAGCDCGEPGCWPLEAHMTESDESIWWEHFSQPHRRWWTYEAVGRLDFERASFEAAFSNAGLPPLKPRERSTRLEALPPLPDLALLELAGWGYDDRLDIGDAVRARLGLRRGEDVPDVSTTALTLASGLCSSLGTSARQHLKEYIGRLILSGNDLELESRRVDQLRSWYVDNFAAAWLRLADETPPYRFDDWKGVRDGLRELKAQSAGEPHAYIRRLPSSTGWDEPPGGELLHAVSQDVEQATGLDVQMSRIIWSACWYAAVLGMSRPNGKEAVARVGAAVAASAFELLDSMV